MSVNKHKPHLLVLPEDDPNRQMADGFALDLNCNYRAIQVLREAGGWVKVVDIFKSDYLPGMRQFPERRMVLLMDFDGKPEDRKSFVAREIPEDIKNRVFVLGVSSEPENLRNATDKKYEEIGTALAEDCAENRQDFWMHDLLKHNEPELNRLIEDVRPFLFK